MDSALFEFADKIYDIYGDVSGYKLAYPACKKSLSYLMTMQNQDGLYANGLCDWAGPFKDFLQPPAPLTLTDSVLMYKCLRITEKAANVLGKKTDKEFYGTKAAALKTAIIKEFIGVDGRSVIPEMSVLALLIAFGLYNDISPLKAQLKEEVEKHKFHHYCGMISLRYLYDALDKSGLSDYAYRIITAKGFPSYKKWIDDGETSLCETWTNGASHNHHMFSSFNTWTIKTLCGVSIDKGVIKTTPPLDLVENIKITVGRGKNIYTMIKKDRVIKYENN